MTEIQITHAIRRLLSGEKDQSVTPLDLLQTIRLLVQRADEKDAYMSQTTLAIDLCSSEDSIASSQKRLSKLKWLTVRKGAHRGSTNRYHIDLTKLPPGDLHKTVVTPQAKRIAVKFSMALKVSTRKRFQKGYLQQWSFSVQKMIDRVGANEATDVMNFAFGSPQYATRALKGPGEIIKLWTPLTADYAKWKAQTATAASSATSTAALAAPAPEPVAPFHASSDTAEQSVPPIVPKVAPPAPVKQAPAHAKPLTWANRYDPLTTVGGVREEKYFEDDSDRPIPEEAAQTVHAAPVPAHAQTVVPPVSLAPPPSNAWWKPERMLERVDEGFQIPEGYEAKEPERPAPLKPTPPTPHKWVKP